MIRLRCVMPWQTYRVGDVIEPPSAIERGRLLGMRFAGRSYWEIVEEPPPAKEQTNPPPRRRKFSEAKP